MSARVVRSTTEPCRGPIGVMTTSSPLMSSTRSDGRRIPVSTIRRQSSKVKSLLVMFEDIESTARILHGAIPSEAIEDTALGPQMSPKIWKSVRIVRDKDLIRFTNLVPEQIDPETALFLL